MIKNFEKAFNTIVNQIVFTNALGEFEYHPEREYFVLKYVYLKYFKGVNFVNDFDSDTDLFRLDLYEDLDEEMNSYEFDYDHCCFENPEFDYFVCAARNKIEYIKERSLKAVTFSATDIYLAELIQKATEAFDNLGLDKLDAEGLKGFLDVLAKIGDTNGNKKLPRTKQKTK